MALLIQNNTFPVSSDTNYSTILNVVFPYMMPSSAGLVSLLWSVDVIWFYFRHLKKLSSISWEDRSYRDHTQSMKFIIFLKRMTCWMSKHNHSKYCNKESPTFSPLTAHKAAYFICHSKIISYEWRYGWLHLLST